MDFQVGGYDNLAYIMQLKTWVPRRLILPRTLYVDLLHIGFKLLTFEMCIGVELACIWKQSFSQNANAKGALPKLNCSSTADFTPHITKVHHGTDHVYSCLILGFYGSIQCMTRENST